MPSRTALHEAEASAGAQFVDQAGWEVPRHFGNVEQEYQSAYKRAALFDLGHQGKVEVCGPEAAAFLHNLCTNEIKQLEIGKGCEAFFATLKARVVGHAFIYRARSDDGQDVFFLDTAPGQGESLARHLDHYLISEQAEIKDRTGQFSQLYVAGPQAPALVQQVLGNDFSRLANLEVREAIDHADVKYQVRRHDFLGLPGYHLLCANELASVVWGRLRDAGAIPAGSEAFETLRLEAGTPIFGRDFDDSHLVMEIGRTRDAISYSKGCYLGQEPVVRSRDLGHVNRSLLGIKLRSGQPAKPGAKLFRNDSEVGQITSSVFSPRLEAAIALAYVRRGSQQPGTELEVELESGRCKGEVSALPFLAGAPG